MATKKNAARVAVAAKPCQKQPDLQPLDALDCIALGLPLSAIQPPMPDAQKQARMDCNRVFSVPHPEDVIAPIRTAADALGWLAEVFKTIEAEAQGHARIRTLAEMGAYLASDMWNLASCAHESMHEAIKKGGAA